MFWICDESSVASTLMFQSLLSRACTAPRPVLCLTLPCQQAGWGCMGGWEGTQPGQLTPSDQKDTADHMTSCLAIKLW